MERPGDEFAPNSSQPRQEGTTGGRILTLEAVNDGYRITERSRRSKAGLWLTEAPFGAIPIHAKVD